MSSVSECGRCPPPTGFLPHPQTRSRSVQEREKREGKQKKETENGASGSRVQHDVRLLHVQQQLW